MEKGSYKEERRKLRGSLLQVVKTDTMINSIGEKDNQIWPGSFVAARPLQEQMMTVEGAYERNQAEIGPPLSLLFLVRHLDTGGKGVAQGYEGSS
jgi:hypothetical protein